MENINRYSGSGAAKGAWLIAGEENDQNLEHGLQSVGHEADHGRSRSQRQREQRPEHSERPRLASVLKNVGIGCGPCQNLLVLVLIPWHV